MLSCGGEGAQPLRPLGTLGALDVLDAWDARGDSGDLDATAWLFKSSSSMPANRSSDRFSLPRVDSSCSDADVSVSVVTMAPYASPGLVQAIAYAGNTRPPRVHPSLDLMGVLLSLCVNGNLASPQPLYTPTRGE